MKIAETKNRLTEGQKFRTVLTLRKLLPMAKKASEYFTFEPDNLIEGVQLLDELEFEEVDPVVAEAVRRHRKLEEKLK